MTDTGFCVTADKAERFSLQYNQSVVGLFPNYKLVCDPRFQLNYLINQEKTTDANNCLTSVYPLSRLQQRG